MSWKQSLSIRCVLVCFLLHSLYIPKPLDLERNNLLHSNVVCQTSESEIAHIVSLAVSSQGNIGYGKSAAKSILRFL